MEKSYDINHFIIMYLIGYAFYSYQILTQLLFAKYSLNIVIPVIVFFFLMPFFLFFFLKKLKSIPKYNPKIRFFISLISFVYLFIINLIAINYTAVMIHNYYYQDLQCYVIAFFLLIPCLYMSFKKSSNYYSLAFIFLFLFIAFKFLYTMGHQTTDFYPLTNIFATNNLFTIILLTIPIMIEPIIILNNTNYFDYTKKINTKLIIIISSLISILGIYIIIRETMEFGLLLNTLSFPYFESYKLISIRSNFDNVDYFYLFSITLSLFTRFPITFLNLKDQLNLNIKGNILYHIVILILFYYLQMKLEFYITILTPLLIFCNCLLILLLILSLFNKRRKKDAI